MNNSGAISGTRRQMREMADGTIRVQIDIDPACRADFLKMFPAIDLPVAIAPLVPDFESRQDRASEEKVKGGALAKLAGMWCNDQKFRDWLSGNEGLDVESVERAAFIIRSLCRVDSRAELDSNPVAADRFNDLIRKPFMEWMSER